jgi:hypothetical protein
MVKRPAALLIDTSVGYLNSHYNIYHTTVLLFFSSYCQSTIDFFFFLFSFFFFLFSFFFFLLTRVNPKEDC